VTETAGIQCLQGYLYADYSTLAARFGQPDPASISDPDRVSAEWTIPLDGDTASIYDYYEHLPRSRRRAAMLTSTEWHVGASHPAALEAVSHMVFGADGYTITPGRISARLREARAKETP
jgi:hypothetical protein